MSSPDDVEAYVPGLIEQFSLLEDPRDPRGVRHRLVDLVVVSVLAVICGANTSAMMHTFGINRLDWLRRVLTPNSWRPLNTGSMPCWTLDCRPIPRHPRSLGDGAERNNRQDATWP